MTPTAIPLSLYLHVPWCIRKCPYCDFNSHAAPQGALSDELQLAYRQALELDLLGQQPLSNGRPLQTIFVGGGTPSLLAASHYQTLFLHWLPEHFALSSQLEITLEANPGTLEHQPFEAYLEAGINRLSLGVQTLDSDALKRLGRIHSPQQAIAAIQAARRAGFQRVNADLMHGLPYQTPALALADLEQVIEAGTTHISWYQLTIEPNTVFYRQQPILPDEDRLAEIQEAGEACLRKHGFIQYEVSAWVKPYLDEPCRHNLNYWQFGDYLAAGAGAHGKITQGNQVFRYQKTRLPQDYLHVAKSGIVPSLHYQAVAEPELTFEYLMNALRLTDGVPVEQFTQRTGLPLSALQPQWAQLQQLGLLDSDPVRLKCTALGQRYLNHVLSHFLAADD